MNINKLLYKQIKKHENIIIAKHKMPDWDGQGSAFGLAHIINDNFKNKNIFVVGERINSDETFSPDKLTEKIIKSALFITVDTANKERIDFDKMDLVNEIFQIDHHIPVDNYATYQLTVPDAIACTQLITLWAHELKLKISSAAAHNLYLGLVTDSGRFLFPETNSDTFLAAKILLDAGVDLKKANDYIYVSNLNHKKWLNYAFSLMKVSKKKVAHIILKHDETEKWNKTYAEKKSVLNIMSGMEEIEIWFLVIELEDGTLKTSLRSRNIPIDKIANKYNGGGHKFAAGCILEKATDVKKLVKDLEDLV